MNLVVTEEVVRRLRERRVFFEYFLSEHRLRVGDVVEFDEQAVVEPYCGIFAGLAVPTIGAFSFIRSALPPTFRIGRYCSIGPDVSAPFPRHPIEFAGSTPC